VHTLTLLLWSFHTMQHLRMKNIRCVRSSTWQKYYCCSLSLSHTHTHTHTHARTHTFMPSLLLVSYTIHTTVPSGWQCTNLQEIKSCSSTQELTSHNSQYRQKHTKCNKLGLGFVVSYWSHTFLSAGEWRMVTVTYVKGYKWVPYGMLTPQFFWVIISYVIFLDFTLLNL
jgi:hypothetical protein